MHQVFSRLSSAIAAGLLLSLAACATSPTPFQQADEDGGYTDRKLENGSYQVTFTGNEATPRRTVQESVLFRAAQVTLQADGSHFRVLSNTVEPVADPSEGSGFDLSSFFGSSAGEALVSTLDFVLVEDDPSSDNPNIYNARTLIGELKDSVLTPNSARAAIRNGAIVNDLRAPRTGDF